MITERGYTKDPSIQPDGVVITWGIDLIKEKGGLLAFIRYFEKEMCIDGSLWLQKSKNQPKHDIIYVYVIVCGVVRYRLYYGGYEKGLTTINNGNGASWSRRTAISWPRIICAGPFTKAPYKIKYKGFQGFRYCTKLF